MKEFIKNNKKTIIRTLIFIAFVLPSIVLSYLALLGINVSNSQGSASFILLFVGGVILIISKLSEIDY
nr:MAG TPA: hypothetical protein [Caudoviricetes sp.]